MGRLVIAHHKSYHPYKAENIERVRRDEEEARLNEAKEEGRLRLADSEARIDLLRKRAGIRDSDKKSTDSVVPQAVKDSFREHQSTKAKEDPLHSLMSNGHINLFADIENNEAAFQQAIDRSTRKKGKKGEEEDAETDKGYRLAPSEADRTPWYTKSKGEGHPKLDQGKRERDEMRKQRHDPLKDVEESLSRKGSTSNHGYQRRLHAMDPPPRASQSSGSLLESRLQREQSERERAAALIAQRKKEKEMAMRGSETPSSVAPSEGGYGDLYNKMDVEEAARRRRGEAGQWRNHVRRWDGSQGRGQRW